MGLSNPLSPLTTSMTRPFTILTPLVASLLEDPTEMPVLLDVRSLSTPTEDGVLTEEEPSLEKTPQRSIVLPPTPLVGLPRVLLPQDFAEGHLQLSYAIGVPYPLSVFVDSYGTAANGKSDADLTEIVNKNFDLRPGCIIRDLNLKRPVMRKTAAYGHFGRDDEDFTWEVVKDLEL